MSTKIIEVRHLSKCFPSKSGDVHALKDVPFSVEKGDIYGIIGLSGAGKSTLVRCLNLLELSRESLPLERQKIGMIFQHFNLLAQRTVLGNVCFPMEITGIPKAERKKRGMELLKSVGLAEKANAYPSQLSGGQKQRVAIVRALAMHPDILLFDEVTAALHPEMVREVLETMLELARSGRTMLIVTHEMSFARAVADRILFLDGGELVEESNNPKEFFRHQQTERAQRFLNTFEYEYAKGIVKRCLIRLYYVPGIKEIEDF